MQFKIGENLPVEVAELLVNADHDAKTVNEQQLQGTKDPLLIDICKSENRVLVSLDTDFSNITTYAPRDFSGIIVLKVGSQAKYHIRSLSPHYSPCCFRNTFVNCQRPHPD
ncbi:MAG: hypothetical protein DDT18_00035 [Actinobacteria bacterium]|nr:hypothetical protein [Actinomycetota bacterium]